MFFTAYIGTDAGSEAWRLGLAPHAAWLGLMPTVQTRRLATGGVVSVAWLARTPVDHARQCRLTGDVLLVWPLGSDLAAEAPLDRERSVAAVLGDWRSNTIRIAVDVRDGSVAVAVPPATPEQIYWTRTDTGYLLADDLRLFASVGSPEIDERAAYALLQYGSIPAPLTIFTGVHRIPTGHLSRLGRGSDETSVPLPPDSRGPCQRDGVDPAQWVLETLDRVLARAPSPAMLYFSGGVDSSLLASRLARLGRADVRLVNYTFGTGDEESGLARKMAARFGLRYQQVEHRPAHVVGVLDRLGRDYSFPFGDFSTVPTNLLVHASLALNGPVSTVIEGTGADGGFGLAARFPVWSRAYSVPAPLRAAVGASGQWLGLWRRRSGLARLSQNARRSVHLPLELAVLAQNALDGLAYDAAETTRAEVGHCIRSHVYALSNGHGQAERISLLDLVLVCAGRMAPKSFDPLRTRGVFPVYPYLDPSMAYGSASLPADQKCAGGEAKSLLKALLARDVPAEWVYRRKSGFTPPYRTIFASPPVQDYLRGVVLSASNPMLDFCRVDVVREIVERAGRSEPVAIGALDFLWALTFTSGWLMATMDHSHPVH